MARSTHLVPLIPQKGLFSCWLASFQMVEAWYNKLLPRRKQAVSARQVDAISSDDAGEFSLQPGGVRQFATSFGMTVKEASPTAEGLAKLLTIYGPLWYGGKNNGFFGAQTAGHAVVITGIQGDLVFFNNPWPVRQGNQGFMAVKDFFDALKPFEKQALFLVMLKGSGPRKG